MRIQSLWYVLVLSLLLVGMTGCGDETDGGGSTAGDGSILGPDGSGSGDGTGDSNSTGGGGDSNTTTQTRTLAVLGNGAHTMDAVAAMALVGPQEGLFGPRDLEFKPDADMELWIVNRNDNSMTIIQDAGGAAMDIMTVSHFSGGHFMVNPISLSFGAPGSLATIHETDQITQPSTPADFMGPTLHSSIIAEFDGGHGGHLDMLHNSPNGVGIAWERDNAYWVFDGYHSSVTRYDFNADHGLGGSDHTDGEVDRYIEDEVLRVPDVLSKMIFDPTTDMLYIADSGHGRVLILDTTSGTRGAAIFPNYDGTRQNMVDNAAFDVMGDGSMEAMLVRPSGLAIQDDVLFVADNATGIIYGFDRDDGSLIDYLETGAADGALQGITLDTNGSLYFVDGVSEQVWRVSPLAE